MSDMSSGPQSGGGPLPPDLRFLKRLVTVLAGTMIAGLITIIALLVMRFPQAPGARPALPERISLPAGAKAEAVTAGRGWVAVVTEAGEILIFDAATGALTQTVSIAPAP
jgi:hypothetical protein